MLKSILSNPVARWFQCSILISLPILAQESSLPVYREAGSIPLMGWVCDSSKSTAEARRISLSAMDFARDSEGRAYLGYDQQFRTWIPKGMGLTLLKKESAPGTVAPGASVAKVKFRKGQYWVKDQENSKVLQWDAKATTWRVALNPGYEFGDFEVSFHGQIVLFGTEHDGKKHLLESFEYNGKSPVGAENYPDSGLSAKDQERCGYSWDLLSTCASDEFIVCYYAMAGRLFVYDTAKRALREIATPWKPLSADWLHDQDKEYGVMNMNAFPGLRCLQFVPTPGRNAVGLAYQIPGKAPRKRVLVDGKPKMVPVGADKLADPVKVLELDLIEMKARPLATDVAASLPVWLKDNGGYGPLAKALEAPVLSVTGLKKPVQK